MAQMDTIFKQEARVDGIPAKLGEYNVIVPPLTLGQLKKYGKLISELQNSPNNEPWSFMVGVLPIIAVALQRNYPGVTVEMLEELIDLGNFTAVFQAVLKSAGLVGEVKPVTTMKQ